MITATKEQLAVMTKEERELYRQWEKDKARVRLSKEQHIKDNLIKYWHPHNEDLDKEFPELRLKGANPLQEKLLIAWDNPVYKVFTFTGSNRLGKTTILIIIGLSVMFGEWLWSGVKMNFIHNHPRKVRLVGQDWEKHIKTVTIPALKKWWPKERPLEIKKNSQGIEALFIDVLTGSTLEIMSNKQESDLHEGWDGDLILYDEPPKRDIRVANARGLIDREGRELFAMTLLKEAWVHREVINARDEDGKPDRTVFSVNGDISINVGYGLTQEGVDQFKKTLKPEEIEARIYGKPSYLSGLIFPKFDRQIHVRERFDVPLDWPVDISIDYHPRKPIRIQALATDKIDRKWVVWEYNRPGNYKMAMESMVKWLKYNNIRLENIVCDPLAKGDPNSDLHEESTYEKMDNILFPYGYSLSTANKDEEGGITAINEILIMENGEPGLFVFRDCVETIEHIEGWMWQENGRPAREEEDMCENLYRTVLLDTKYTEPRQVKSSYLPTNWKVV